MLTESNKYLFLIFFAKISFGNIFILVKKVI